ncbi:MAG: GNAT family N-acetyltransferase [Bacteroidota bacterium]
MPQTLTAIEIREGLDGITPARVATLYRRAPLVRPTGSPEQLARMFEQSSLVLGAWMGNRLVGLARVLTDGAHFSFLCDLAVEPDVQGAGVGRQLIDQVLERCKGTELILRDSDISAGFYRRLGFEKVTNAWMRKA